MITSEIRGIIENLNRFSNDIDKATQKISADFLPEILHFANYFSDYFRNGLLILVSQDEVEFEQMMQTNEFVNFFKNNPSFVIEIIKILKQKQKHQLIVEFSDVVLRDNPDHLGLLGEKGLALLELRDYKKLDVFCLNALQRHPNNFILNEVYARNAHRKGDWEEALVRWLAVVDKFPNAINPANQLEFVAKKLKNYNVLERLYKSQKEKLSYQQNLKNQACLLEMKGAYEEATRCYQQLLLLDDNNEVALLSLLECYARLRYTDLLETHLDRILHLPKSLDFKFSIADNLAQKFFMYDVADGFLENLLKINPGNPKILSKISFDIRMRNYGSDRYDRYVYAKEILELLVESHPQDNNYKVNLADMYIILGENHKAKNIVDQIDSNYKHPTFEKLKAWYLVHFEQKYENANLIWQDIAKSHYKFGQRDLLHELEYISVDKSIKVKSEEILLFVSVRDEMLRVPYFLEYYRNLGVDKFFIIDNDSTDGLQEFLLKQDDVYLFYTNYSFAGSACALAWVNSLIKKYANNNWILNVDADELLVYPDCETKNLKHLCGYMDRHNEKVLASYMLDMFPGTLKEQLDIKSGDNFLEKASYFYNNYVVLGTLNPPFIEPRGGIFSKLLGPRYLLLMKAPLIKASGTITHLLCAHITTAEKVSQITGASLHFKFLGNFLERAKEEVNRGQHAGGGIIYKGYYDMMNGLPDDFAYTSLDKTVRYQNSQQLVELGLIQKSADF